MRLTGNESKFKTPLLELDAAGAFEVVYQRTVSEKAAWFPHVCLHTGSQHGASPTVGSLISGEPLGMLPRL